MASKARRNAGTLAKAAALSIVSRMTALAEIDPALGTAPSDHAAVVANLKRV
jgi:hypothetical protein